MRRGADLLKKWRSGIANFVVVKDGRKLDYFDGYHAKEQFLKKMMKPCMVLITKAQP